MICEHHLHTIGNSSVRLSFAGMQELLSLTLPLLKVTFKSKISKSKTVR